MRIGGQGLSWHSGSQKKLTYQMSTFTCTVPSLLPQHNWKSSSFYLRKAFRHLDPWIQGQALRWPSHILENQYAMGRAGEDSLLRECHQQEYKDVTPVRETTPKMAQCAHFQALWGDLPPDIQMHTCRVLTMVMFITTGDLKKSNVGLAIWLNGGKHLCLSLMTRV